MNVSRGGGKAPKPPKPVIPVAPAIPAPDTNPATVESQAAAQQAAMIAGKRRATELTGPGGLNNNPAGAGKTLLGQ